jgi:hypothetical protein
LDIRDYVTAGATGDENQVKTTAPAVIPLKFSSASDPWRFFLYALMALAYKDKHIQRLLKFLDLLGYTGTNDDRARAFVTQARTEPNYAFNSVLKFFQRKREQIDRKQIA